MTDNDTNIIIVIALVIFVGLIAAAEITGADAIHPGYGFEHHAGYATEVHFAGINTHGPLPGLQRLPPEA